MEPEHLEVRCAVRQALNTLSSSKDRAEITHTLQCIKRYLGGAESDIPLRQREEFVNVHYSRFLHGLIGSLSADCLEQQQLFDELFLEGPADQAFLVLLDTIASTSSSPQQTRCVNVLERFLRDGRMTEMIWEFCQTQDGPSPSNLHQAILSKTVSLPDHLANKLQSSNRPAFYPNRYFPLLAQQMLLALRRLCNRLKGGKDCSLCFMSQLLGKLCVQGHGDAVLQVLLPPLTSLTQSDYIWQRICWRLVENVPDRWMESVISGLVCLAAGPEVLCRVLGSIVLKNKKAQFVVTHKLLLLQFSYQTAVLQSLLGYLAGETGRRHLLIKVLKQLMETWSNRSAVRHTPVEQQLYITKAILISLAHLRDSELQEHRAELLAAMMSGMECHLDSNLPRVRRLGMLLAQSLSPRICPSEQPLSFQYEEDEETNELQSLLILRPQSSWKSTQQEQSDAGCEPARDIEEQCAGLAPPGLPSQDPESDSELDSDDELIPYDMSGDRELQKCKAPAYISGCVEVLMNCEDPEQIEATLNTVESLIRKTPAATKELSLHLARLLLHLDDKYNIEGFVSLRQRAMVGLLVVDTIAVAQYLTQQFYAVNYSLCQRLDILDVLALAAQELSQPGTESKAAPAALLDCGRGGGGAALPVPHAQHWRRIVDERIKSKTRRFAQGVSRPEAIAAPNRYGPVAAHFFFPLISNYDRPQTSFDFLGEQPLMMGRLIHTLGILMYFAVNTPIAIHMGKSLLDFIWTVRYHTDTYVRQGILFAVSSLLLSVPSEGLLSEVLDEVLELRCWLADVAEKDADGDCRRLAVQSLLLLENIRQKLGICLE
uniref:Telomere length regulation protein TEL2 homolog n=1 Tax=Callorhinchus milii TaxID=7868 RepID=A0A4W3HN57_CALMI|eukprot:gi/632952454/ref/XP_007891861.1/ PREDICTED: telomere length regulation protein TEL2 homolog [Callorhinchus milii]